MENINLSVDELNKKMNDFIDNRNKLAKIHTEFVNLYGKEYYLSSLSNTLVEAFNTFEKFYPVVVDKEDFATKLLNVSLNAIDFFSLATKESLGNISNFKKRRILRKLYPENVTKMNNLLKSLDAINDIINRDMLGIENRLKDLNK